MTADVELLPCPWCGGKIEGNVSEGSTFRWRKVDGCCADGPEVRHNTTAPDQGIAEHESRIAAIKAWNTRAATAAKDAENEALREQLSRLDEMHVELGRQLVAHEERAERLAEALRRCTKWGGLGKGWDSGVALDLIAWIEAGMVGELPPLPHYLGTGE